MKYRVRFNTGAGDYETATLIDAMEYADECASYTQQDIEIVNDAGDVEAVRRWWGIEAGANEQEEDIISFGKFGHYGPWE